MVMISKCIIGGIVYSWKTSVSNFEIFAAYMSDSTGNAYNRYTSCWKPGRMYDLACYGFWDNNINVYKNYTPQSQHSCNVYTKYTSESWWGCVVYTQYTSHSWWGSVVYTQYTS